VAEIKLVAKTPLEGKELHHAGCLLREIDTQIMSLAIPLGDDAAFEAEWQNKMACALPTARLSSTSGAIRALRTAPDQLMLIGPNLRAISSAYSTDQSGNWTLLELSGPNTMAALERLCPVDLAASVFPKDAFARTVMEHMGAIVIRTGPDCFLLMSASSSARSFWHALETTLRYID